MFLAFKDDTKPGRSSIPDEIYGQTDVLDKKLIQSLKIPPHKPENAPV